VDGELKTNPLAPLQRVPVEDPELPQRVVCRTGTPGQGEKRKEKEKMRTKILKSPDGFWYVYRLIYDSAKSYWSSDGAGYTTKGKAKKHEQRIKQRKEPVT